jgi:hypothetical protein
MPQTAEERALAKAAREEAARLAKESIRVKTYLPEGTVRSKNLGFIGKPDEDVIDAPFECSSVSTSKKNPNYKFITLQIEGPTKSFGRYWSCGELAGLTKGPVVTMDDGKLGVNENMLVTWTRDMEEPEFHAAR